MSGAARRVAWYRFTRTFRGRRGGYLAIVLLVGLVGGLAMAAVAGARRTQSAFPAYLAASNAGDLQTSLYFGGGAALSNLYDPQVTARLARLPHVRHVAAMAGTFAAPLSASGRAALPAPLQDNQVQTVGSLGGEFWTQDRVVADQGRVPDPARVDEIALTPEAARLLHWHVGQTLPMGVFSFAQVTNAPSPGQLGAPRLRIEARVVGVVTFSTDVVHDQVDRYPTFVLLTPALTRELLPLGGAGFVQYSLRLGHGAADAPAVEREIIASLPRGTLYAFHVTAVGERQVERSTEPTSIALGVFGAVAGAAALSIAGQAVGRELRSRRRDRAVLRALGARRTVLVADGLLGPAGAAGVGAILAALLCVALSPLTPVGAVRRVDPAAGFRVDWAVVGLGAAGLVLVLSAFALLVLVASTRRLAGADDGPFVPLHPSRVLTAAARTGMSPASMTGIGWTLVRGRGRDAAPVGSALLGAAVAVMVVAATLTFGSGLRTLVSHPALYGWNWDYAITASAGGQVLPSTENLLARDRYVAGWTGYRFGDAQIDRTTVPIVIVDPGASVLPPLLEGRYPHASDEIVMGATTLAQLDKHLGDTVVLSYGSSQNAPAYVPPTRLRVVGTVTLPAVGSPGTLHVSMGTGAVVQRGIEPPAFRAFQNQPDPNLDGPDLVAIRLRPGADAAAALASLRRIVTAADGVAAADPNVGGGTFEVLPVQEPAEIINYRTTGADPAVLAAGLAAGAAAALGFTLVASVRRRRRDLALLKTIGFSQRQLAAVVSWQASVAAVVGFVVGLPLGAALGRTLWRLFAHQIDVVPAPSVPVGQLALVALAALILANAVSLVPGRIAARTPAALLLRAE